MRRTLSLTQAGMSLRDAAVIALTVALLVTALATLPGLTTRLSTGGWIPNDSEAVAVDERLASQFNRRATSHLVLLSPAGSEHDLNSVEAKRDLARITSQLQSVPGVTGVYSPLSAPTGALRSSLVSADGTKWLVVVQVEQDLQATIEHLPEIRDAIESDVLTGRITGVPALSHEFAEQVKTDLQRAELIALPIALLCLAWFAGGFRIALAIVLTTLTSLSTIMVGVMLASHVVTISIFALSTVAMLTIALSLDFGLLYALRRDDRGGRQRVRHTITVAALAVIAGLAGLSLLPVDAARSIGGVSVLGIGVAVLCQRTVLPVWSRILRVSDRPPASSSPQPSRWLTFVGQHPARCLILGLVVLIPLLAPVARTSVVGPDTGLLPKSSPAAAALEDVTSSFSSITASPITIVATPVRGSMLDASNLFSLRQLEERLESLPGVDSVMTVWDLVPGGISSPVLTASLALDPTLVEQARPLITERGAVIEISASGTPDERAELVDILRSQQGRLSDGELRLAVGGADAAGVDLITSIESMLVPMIALVVLASAVVLAVAFRSIVLPLKAVLLNAIPVLSGLGAVTLLFQLGTPWSEGAGSTVIIVPMILAWLMYGVSMDYEVFMLSRIREYRQQGYANRDATLRGVEGARAVVSRGAILMGIVFLAFSTSDVLAVRAIGVGLLVAIIVDATIVRLILLPASMILLGRWNWWWPQWLPARPATDHAVLPEQVVSGDH